MGRGKQSADVNRHSVQHKQSIHRTLSQPGYIAQAGRQAQWSITRATFVLRSSDYGQPQSTEHCKRQDELGFALIIYVELSEAVADWRQLSALLFYMSNESDAALARINQLENKTNTKL